MKTIYEIALVFGALLLPACASTPASTPTPTPVIASAGAGCHAPASIRSLATATVPKAAEQKAYVVHFGARKIVVGLGRYRLPGKEEFWNKMYGWGPTVWVTEAGRTRLLDLRAELPSQLVSHVYADERSGRIVAFFENGVEGPGTTYLPWISLDRGEHWFAGAPLERPRGSYEPATLMGFYLDRDGKGAAWLKAEADEGDSYHRAATADCGQSWKTELSFTNVLKPAEEAR